MSQQGGLDLAKLRKMQSKIKDKAGQGEGNLLYSNKLPNELDVRLLPPRPEMNGVYFHEQTGWWVNGKFVLVDADNDVIQEVITEALNSGDKSVAALINKVQTNGSKTVKKEVRYAVPLIVLATEFNDDDTLKMCEVESVKTLLAKPTLMAALNEVVTSRPYQNGTADGIMDRVKGCNIIIGKSGVGINTTYKAQGWRDSMELDEKYYTDKAMPNILKDYEKAKPSDERARSIICNYLYGDPIIEDTQTGTDTEAAEESAPRRSRLETSTDDLKDTGRASRTSRAAEPAPARAARTSATDEPKASRPTRAAKVDSPKETARPATRNILEDAEGALNDLD